MALRNLKIFLVALFLVSLHTLTAAQSAALSLEAPLVSGNLGKAGEVSGIGGNFATGITGATGASGQLKAGALNLGSNQGQLQNLTNLGSEKPLPALAETRFQQFVEDSSGKKLSLYGYNLFESSKFTSLTDVPVPANYVLGPGDEVDLKLWGMAELSTRLLVDRQGQVMVPRVGPVSVVGVRADQLEQHLKTQVGKVFSNFELSATVGKLRSVQIFVVGQARRPGAYMVSSLSTLISALFESGGPSASGSMRAISLTRGGRTITTLDLYEFIHQGDTSKDARLLPGDVIVIPQAGARVALLGETDSPAIYELSGQEQKIAELLNYSATQKSLISRQKIQLERLDSSSQKGPRIVETAAFDEKGLSTKLKDGDIVTLLKISPEFANAVTLRGNVAVPIRHAYQVGMRVSDLIPEPQALVQADYFLRKNKLVQYELGRENTKDASLESILARFKSPRDEINWDYATIERVDPEKLVTSLIPFNLAKAIKSKDQTHDLLLKVGDVLTVYSVNDLPPPLESRNRFVKVTGEVKVPGIYQLKSTESMLDVVRYAGGFTKNAYLYGAVLTRESVRINQQDNLNRVIRRMEADLEAKSASLMQNSIANEKGSMEALLSQQVSQRQMIKKLESLKASGRLALEMDPINTKLPFVLMEDADEIFIPSTPSFVNVYGAVFAESSFIYRPGQTVRDYLDKAGVTREADIDEVIVMRADGTAEASPKGLVFKNMLGASVLRKELYPGDSVLVPELVDKRSPYTAFIQGAKDWTQLIYQMGLGAAAIKTLRQ